MTEDQIDNIESYFDSTYDFWVNIYGYQQKWNEFNSIHQREKHALKLIEKERKGTVVDIGCGSGHALIKIKRLGFEKVIGIDISTKLTLVARELAHRAGYEQDIEVIRSDARSIPQIADESVDVIIALGVIEHLEEDMALLKEANRILAPGGKLVIQTRNYPCINTRVRELIKKILPGHDKPIWYREHWPSKICCNLKKAGFELEERRYSHYYPLFPFNLIPGLNKLIKPFNNFLSQKAEIFANSAISYLFASMYIAKARKVGLPE